MSAAGLFAAEPAPLPRRSWFGPLNPTIRDWAGQHVWIVGASSGIGAELARLLIDRGAVVALSARREAALLEIAGTAAVEILPLDVVDAQQVAAACEALRQRWGRIDLVLWVAGTHEPMRAQDFELTAARRLLDTNFAAVLGGLAAVLPALLSQRRGGIAFVSSVAGYRGLPRALVYGPTKAALSNLAESLYFDLRPVGVGVYLVNPGFVATPLTARNDFAMPALLTARAAALATLAGISDGRFEVHYPRRFTWLMKLARLLPYRLYFAAVRALTRL
jgi:NADP-dependent 3-hydroxy acid dehydrogenase YdfG